MQGFKLRLCCVAFTATAWPQWWSCFCFENLQNQNITTAIIVVAAEPLFKTLLSCTICVK